MAHYWGNLSLCKKSAEMCTKWPFLVIFAIFGRFWPFLAVFEKKMSEIMSYTCLPWPTTGTTLHSVRIMQKCAQNVQKCAKKSFFGQILAKKRIFDAPKFFFLLFSFQKWIPLEKLDIKHVLYDFLHAISIIFKGVKKNVSIALSNYTRNSCAPTTHSPHHPTHPPISTVPMYACVQQCLDLICAGVSRAVPHL